MPPQWMQPSCFPHDVEAGGMGSHACYYDTEAGANMATVRSTSELESVVLCYAKIRLTEIKGMLQCLGSRLKCLHLSVEGQDESPRLRLREVIVTARRHNSGLRLRDITVTDNYHLFWKNSDGTKEEKERWQELMKLDMKMCSRTVWTGSSGYIRAMKILKGIANVEEATDDVEDGRLAGQSLLARPGIEV